jgi:exonuclease SbcD
MGGKGEVEITELPLVPLRDMREVRGTYSDIMNRNNYRDTNTEDYIRIVLTDEQDEPDAMAKLRNVYPNLMRLEYDNKRTQASGSFETTASTDKKTPAQLFSELFEKQNGRPMIDEQSGYVESLFNEIWREVANT